MARFRRLRPLLSLGLAVCTAGPLTAESPVELFATHCAACHGVDGKARTPAGRKLKAKDFSRSTLEDADIQRIILAGVRDAKGTLRMPPFEEKLAPAEVSRLVEYVKSFRSR
jgi:mono/diheme cytochrome c family protein